MVEDSNMGLQARLMSKAMRVLTGIVNKKRLCSGIHQSVSGEDRCYIRRS